LSSTGGGSKSDIDIISSSDSSDSSRSNSDSSDSDASAVDNNNNNNNDKKKKYKYKYNKMPSSIIKSPVSDGSRATFEEWHSLWEIFGQEQGFDEYQSIVPETSED
jgi:hypothetical protein